MQQSGLPHPRVTNQDKLEQAVVAIGTLAADHVRDGRATEAAAAAAAAATDRGLRLAKKEPADPPAQFG